MGIDLSSLFKLVHVWVWERFKELQPKSVPLLKDDQPRLDRWHDVKQRRSDVRQILENSKIESFEWRPYTIAVGNCKFPKFCPEKAMSVHVNPNLDDEYISFARCIKVSELVGFNGVEHYLPNRVASQFGMLQDVPVPVKMKSLSQEAAWIDYDKPIEDPTLYIHSRSTIPRVTPMFSEWWKKTFPELQSPSKENQSRKNIGKGDDPSFVPSGSKVKRRSEDKMRIDENSESKKRKLMMKQARDKRRKYMMKRACEKDESSTGQVASDNAEEDGSLTIAQMMRLSTKKFKNVKNCGGDTSEPLAEISRLEADNNEKFGLINKRRDHLKQVRDKRLKYMKQARDKRHKRMKQVPSDKKDEDDSLIIAQMRLDKSKCGDVKKSGGDASEPLGKTSKLEADNSESRLVKKLLANETGSKTWEDMVLSPFDENYFTYAPLGASGGVVDVGVSPPETRQTCNGEFDIYGSNKFMIEGGSMEPEWLLRDDGDIVGEKADETEDVVDDDDISIPKALKGCSSQKLAYDDENLCSKGGKEDDINGPSPVVVNQTDESNIDGDGNQRQDCLVDENGIGSEETPIFTKSNDAVVTNSFGKRFHEKVASIQELIDKKDVNVTWLKERLAINQRI